ncbi:MAG: DNA polymerase III subunit delta [Dehalococcoidia bacterium]
MIYVLYGHDEFSLHEELNYIKNGLGDREALATNTNEFDGKQVAPGQLLDACKAMPFLGTHRLVIVDGLLSRFEKGAKTTKGSDGAEEEQEKVMPKKGWRAEWGELQQKLSDVPPTTVLVFIDGDVKKGNLLLKQLAPSAQVRQFSELKGNSLSEWIRNRVKGGGGSIAPEAVKLLAAYAGDNLWVLASEIDKLILFTGGKRIEEKDVKEVVSYAREANIFTMVDALIEGRSATAVPLLQQMLDEGAAAPYILFMITRQVRLLVEVKELINLKCNRNEIRDRMGINNDFVLNKALEQSRNYSMERLEQIYRKILETDISIKQGIWKGDLALDLLVAELCV